MTRCRLRDRVSIDSRRRMLAKSFDGELDRRGE